VPAFGRNVVSTSQPLAAQAGLAMLQRGGNAVDAAVAAAIALTVVEPTGNGIGSDLFAIVWDGRALVGLNASGRAPAAATPARYAGRRQMPAHGWESVTIPGAVSGWRALSDRFGKLAFADLFAPAIRYARDGFPVSPTVAALWERAAATLPREFGFADPFLPGGRAPRPGEIFASAAQAGTLETIARSSGEAFYRGELAHAMVAHARSHGALHTLEDFASHRCEFVTPISQHYAGVDVHEIPPNGQGIAALIALGILGRFDLASLAPDSVESQHLQIEAMKLAFADAYRFVADPAAMSVPPSSLLDPAYVAARAARIDRSRAQDFGPGEPPNAGTVYLCAADERGMMVSLIQSNYLGFGSAVVVPGTGISLQGRASGFTLTPGHPNEVGSGKRPFHTIIPGFLTRHGAPYAAFGVMGGTIQPPAHVQTVVRLATYRMNPQAALDAPRWKLDGDGSVDLETAASATLRHGLAKLGHRLRSVPEPFTGYGSGQFVVRMEGGGYVAASDPRRDGYPAVF
jgi:gamma-glutamyltranspeptidase/glutathione hydrolase